MHPFHDEEIDQELTTGMLNYLGHIESRAGGRLPTECVGVRTMSTHHFSQHAADHRLPLALTGVTDMKMRIFAIAALLGAAIAIGPKAHAVDVGAYVKRDAFESIKLSPNGDFYAATVPLEDRTVLVILRRADNKLATTFTTGKNTVVESFQWVNPERVVVGMGMKFGALEEPQPTGDLYAVDAVTSRAELLVGQHVRGDAGTLIKPKKVEEVAAFVVDDLPADDKRIVISVQPFSSDPYTRAERMDVYSGRRAPIARAPVRNGVFSTDNQGEVRFVGGFGYDNVRKLYYREGNGSEWQEVSAQSDEALREFVLGFSADDSTAYLQSEQETGPDIIYAFDLATRTRRQVLRDDAHDPAQIIYRMGTRIPVGASFNDGKHRNAFFDEAGPEARLYRSLEAAFGDDHAVSITSQTSDGRYALVKVWSDRIQGDFYVFDTVEKKADHLVSRREWFDPRRMAAVRPFDLKARDGLQLHGLLTIPNGSAGKSMPMVVLPHGGPFGEQDIWGFDPETQMLANAGYAVLQVNFRGSGGYGAAFRSAGAREWGGKMQDDVTDATRWAIQQGIADPGRICIYGGSYGAYASLMGLVREPDLYKCAVGYIGVYDLPTVHVDGDVQRRGSGVTYLREWIGERDQLAAVSPTRLAARIKAPVFLAAGGEDERAPIVHSKLMEQALRGAGVPVETLYYPNEGHGFYLEANRREYYTRLLAFLSRNIGGAKAN